MLWVFHPYILLMIFGYISLGKTYVIMLNFGCLAEDIVAL